MRLVKETPLASAAALRHGLAVSWKPMATLAVVGLLLGGAAAGFASPKSNNGLPDLGGCTIVIAVEDDYPPFNFIRADNGRPDGWDYETLREIAHRLNFVPDFREISWDSMVQAVATGQFDMAANGITMTSERARVVDFSTSYAQVRQRLLVRNDEKRFKSLESFAKTPNARLGAQKANTNYSRARELVGPTRIVAYDGFGELIQALLAGDLDAVIIDEVGGQGYIGTHANKLRLLEGALPGQDLAMIFTHGSPFRRTFDAALASMRADGSLERLNARWFSPHVPGSDGAGP